jgi:bifunctional enzyme CysN/CysC
MRVRRLAVVFVGEVDHGKSTLIGRLLLDTGSLSRRREAEARAGSIALAHVIDQLGREQDEGLTVTNAETILRLPDREIVLVDVPGHEEFLRHMLSGSSGAVAGVVVVDAGEGVRPETQRHALLLRLLRIPQVIAVVNKLDSLPDPSAAFGRAAGAMQRVAAALGLPLASVIPASALTGVNVTPRGGGFGWFAGPAVLDALCSFRPPAYEGGPLRFSVQDRYDFLADRVVAGRVERGVLRSGDTLIAVPGGDTVRVLAIVEFPDARREILPAGFSGSIVVDRPDRIRRGQILSPAAALPASKRTVRGRTFCLGQAGIRCGDRFLLRCAMQEAEATVCRIDERLDSGRLAPRPAGDRMEALDLALVTFALTADIVTEDPNESPALGRFVLEDAETAVACGMVEE